MAVEFRYFLPEFIPETDILVRYQLAHNFSREVNNRENFKQYCQWYKETAAEHQLEMQKMSRDINIFGLFLKNKK